MRASIIVFALLVAAASGVGAAETPQFEPGLRTFNRTSQGSQPGSKPVTAATQKCTDPTQLFNKPAQMPGCKFSPMTRSANTYSFTADCTIQGAALTSNTVIAVESDSAYTQTVESHGGGQSTKEVLVAKRVGECPQ
jgi:hypothetical protein